MKTNHIDRKRQSAASASIRESPCLPSAEAAPESVGRAEATSDRPAGDAEASGAAPGPKSRSGKRRGAHASQAKAHQKAKLRTQRRHVAQKTARSGPAARGGQTAEKTPPVRAAREGTKKAKVLALLKRPQGATIAELRQATDWQAHSVRGFLSGTLHQQWGLQIQSGKHPNGERFYSLRG
jgi:Protein of unknown function (DUF3489)